MKVPINNNQVRRYLRNTYYLRGTKVPYYYFVISNQGILDFNQVGLTLSDNS